MPTFQMGIYILKNLSILSLKINHKNNKSFKPSFLSSKENKYKDVTICNMINKYKDIITKKLHVKNKRLNSLTYTFDVANVMHLVLLVIIIGKYIFLEINDLNLWYERR